MKLEVDYANGNSIAGVGIQGHADAKWNHTVV